MSNQWYITERPPPAPSILNILQVPKIFFTIFHPLIDEIEEKTIIIIIICFKVCLKKAFEQFLDQSILLSFSYESLI